VSNIAAGLTISAVSARTGVGVAVLRAWEQRFGFPNPDRLAGGHRRYDEADVAAIGRVVAERDAGRSLETAIAIVLQGGATGSDDQLDRSVFSGLHRARPDLPVHALSRRTMLAMSRSIEDECFAHADRPQLLAAFQTEEAYARSRPRWDDLIGTAGPAIVFADFPKSRRHAGRVEVRVPPDDPLRREWSVVCDAPGSAAVLAGWERPDGRFEAIWTAEAHAVRLATDLGRRLAAHHAPRLRLPDPPAPLPPSHDPTVTVRRATALTNRVIAYLDR
jgi:MerR family transcriptional regulator, light-induced transcriptional regulator